MDLLSVWPMNRAALTMAAATQLFLRLLIVGGFCFCVCRIDDRLASSLLFWCLIIGRRCRTAAHQECGSKNGCGQDTSVAHGEASWERFQVSVQDWTASNAEAEVDRMT